MRLRNLYKIFAHFTRTKQSLYVFTKNKSYEFNHNNKYESKFPLIYLFGNFYFNDNDKDKSKEDNIPINKTSKQEEPDNISSNNIYNITKEQYEALHKIVDKFLNDPAYVYKSCWYRYNNYLIVLKRTSNTITNEKRNGISDPSKAAYRGSEFEVVTIINISNFDCPKITNNEVTNSFSQKQYYEKEDDKKRHRVSWFHSGVTYKVGKIVRPEHEFLNDIDVVKGSGIHFFTDVLRAISYKYSPPCENSRFTGTWNEYLDSGELVSSWNYVNGCKISSNKHDIINNITNNISTTISNSNNFKITIMITGTLIIGPLIIFKLARTIRFIYQSRKLPDINKFKKKNHEY
jgi:hypothetical protein